MSAEVVARDAQGGELRLFRDFTELTVAHKIVLEPEIARSSILIQLEGAVGATPDIKGKALERALSLAVSQVPGWEVEKQNLRTENEELDIVIANNSARAPWGGTGYVVLEAKNWSTNVDRPEYDSLHMKVKERGGFCRLGLFIAAVGFSSGFYTRAEHHGTEHFSIVPLSVPWMAAKLRAGVSIEEVLAERVRQVVLDRHWEEPQF
jgi:hypothetical protein